MALYDPPAALTRFESELLAAELQPERVAAVHRVRPDHVLNLVQLARYLAALPEGYREFTMARYMDEPDVSGAENVFARVVPATCGTVACAVGHGPTAGVAPRPGETWAAYEVRAFGTEGVVCRLHTAMFHGMWTVHDNTPRGAAARIAYTLTCDTRRAYLSPYRDTPGDYAAFLP